MRRIAEKSVPRLLSSDQKEHCILVCIELKEHAENDPNFISTILIGDESGCLGTTLKLISGLFSGRIQLHRDLRKHGKFGAM
jgi:hypothetical protein